MILFFNLAHSAPSKHSTLNSIGLGGRLMQKRGSSVAFKQYKPRFLAKCACLLSFMCYALQLSSTSAKQRLWSSGAPPCSTSIRSRMKHTILFVIGRSEARRRGGGNRSLRFLCSHARNCLFMPPSFAFSKYCCLPLTAHCVLLLQCAMLQKLH